MTQAAPTVWQRGRARWAQWWLSRLIPGDELTLTHRNLYILPSRSGWSLAAVTLVLLLASINEEVNLGYALAFALAGAALAALHQTHDNLRGLRLQLQPPSSAHAGDALTLTVTLDGGAGTRGRHGLRLEVLCEPASPALEVELEAGEAQWVELSVPAARRGRHPLPRIRVTSAYPLGIFRVWAWWRPASAVLIWPPLDRHAPPVLSQFVGLDEATGPALAHRLADGAPEGLRAYQRGDPMHWIAWKKSGGREDLVSRERLPESAPILWLDYERSPALAGLSHEGRLSRLATWLREAEALDGLAPSYGLRLPSRSIGPARGAAHLLQCLDALALSEAPR